MLCRQLDGKPAHASQKKRTSFNFGVPYPIERIIINMNMNVATAR